MANDPLCADEAGLDVFRLEPGVSLKDGVRRITRRQDAKDMLHRQPSTANDRLPAEDLGIDRDPGEQLLFVNHG